MGSSELHSAEPPNHRSGDPVALLKLEHLIVDEFQDLNPLDQQFVDALASGGVRVFVAGDDDQSIYSFRFASPAGIQEFPTHHPGAGLHALTDCFTYCLGAGRADLVSLARAHLADPYLTLHAAARYGHSSQYWPPQYLAARPRW